MLLFNMGENFVVLLGENIEVVVWLEDFVFVIFKLVECEGSNVVLSR